MKRLLGIAVLLGAFALWPIEITTAQQPTSGTAPAVTLPAITQPTPNTQMLPPGGIGVPAIIVQSPDGATIKGGDFLGQVIVWILGIVGTALAGLLAALIVKLMNKFGIEVSDANRARLQQFIENGIALAGKKAQTDLQGKLSIEVKNQVAADALLYVQAHGADTLKALGVDPNDPKALEALEARIEKALNDKANPTVNATVTPGA